MFENYKEAVLSDYQKKKKDPNFSLNLLNPAPARLRDECGKVYEERYIPSDDDNMLRLFFGPKNDTGDYLQIITKFDPDKFRPLVNFLKGITTDPEVKNVELLAWLLDFESRPYATWKNKKKGRYIPSPTPSPGTKLPWKKIGLTSLLLILAVVLGLTKYSSGDDETGTPSTKDTPQTTNPSTTLPTANSKNKSNETNSSPIEKKQCMYWADDHYEPVSCDKLLGDTAKVAIDEQKVALFKKITQPDTLTRNSLGRVWYVKIGGTIEYYTSEGFHPIQTDRKLKKLTDYMLNKYILSRRTFM